LLEGSQRVSVHTIGLALSAAKDAGPAKVAKRKQFLQNIAHAGGGSYYEAEDSQQLLKAFRDVLQQASKVDNATLVNPVATSNSSQSITDQIYYALFQPAASDRWLGNLKRYRLGSKTEKKAVIYDANGL